MQEARRIRLSESIEGQEGVHGQRLSLASEGALEGRQMVRASIVCGDGGRISWKKAKGLDVSKLALAREIAEVEWASAFSSNKNACANHSSVRSATQGVWRRMRVKI